MSIIFSYPAAIFSLSTFTTYPLLKYLLTNPTEIGKKEAFYKKIYQYCCNSTDEFEFNAKLIIINYLCLKQYFGNLNESDDFDYYKFSKWFMEQKESDLPYISHKLFQQKSNSTIYEKIFQEISNIGMMDTMQKEVTHMLISKLLQVFIRIMFIIPCVLLDAFYLKQFNSQTIFMFHYKTALTTLSMIALILFLIWICVFIYQIFVSKWNRFCFRMITSKHPKFILFTSADEFINKCDKILKGYQVWDSNQVIKWIIKLNRTQFVQYIDGLTNGITDEAIDGSKLSSLTNIDLERYGIVNPNHIQLIIDSIQTLIRKDEMKKEDNYRKNMLDTLKRAADSEGKSNVFGQKKKKKKKKPVHLSHESDVKYSYHLSLSMALAILILIFIFFANNQHKGDCSTNSGTVTGYTVTVMSLIVLLSVMGLMGLRKQKQIISLLSKDDQELRIILQRKMKKQKPIPVNNMRDNQYKKPESSNEDDSLNLEEEKYFSEEELFNDKSDQLHALQKHKEEYEEAVQNQIQNIKEGWLTNLLTNDSFGIRGIIRANIFALFMSSIVVYFYIMHFHQHKECRFDLVWILLTIMMFSGCLIWCISTTTYKSNKYYASLGFLVVSNLAICLYLLYMWNVIAFFIVFAVMLFIGCNVCYTPVYMSLSSEREEDNNNYLGHCIVTLVHSVVILMFAFLAKEHDDNNSCSDNSTTKLIFFVVVVIITILLSIIGILLIKLKQNYKHYEEKISNSLEENEEIEAKCINLKLFMLNLLLKSKKWTTRIAIRSILCSVFLSAIPMYFIVSQMYGNSHCDYHALWMLTVAFLFISAAMCCVLTTIDNENGFIIYVSFYVVVFIDICFILSFILTFIYFINKIAFIAMFISSGCIAAFCFFGYWSIKMDDEFSSTTTEDEFTYSSVFSSIQSIIILIFVVVANQQDINTNCSQNSYIALICVTTIMSVSICCNFIGIFIKNMDIDFIFKLLRSGTFSLLLSSVIIYFCMFHVYQNKHCEYHPLWIIIITFLFFNALINCCTHIVVLFPFFGFLDLGFILAFIYFVNGLAFIITLNTLCFIISFSGFYYVFQHNVDEEEISNIKNTIQSILIVLHAIIISIFSYLANQQNNKKECSSNTDIASLCIEIMMGSNVLFTIIGMLLSCFETDMIWIIRKVMKSLVFSTFFVAIPVYFCIVHIFQNKDCEYSELWMLIIVLLFLGGILTCITTEGATDGWKDYIYFYIIFFVNICFIVSFVILL
eukprot:346957_1